MAAPPRPQLTALLLLLSLLCGAAQARGTSLLPSSIVAAARTGGVRQPGALAVAAAAAARRRALQSSTAAHPGNLMCENYDRACNSVLTLAGCDANPLNRVVAGCAGAGNGTLDQFIGLCNCTSPFPLGTPSDRVRDRLFSAAVAGLNAAALINYAAGGEAPPPLLVPTVGYSGPNATFDVGASFGALCARALIALGCPVGREVIVPISPNTTAGGASFRCGCGPTLDVTAAALNMVVDGIVANNTASMAAVYDQVNDDDPFNPATDLMCQKRNGWFRPTCGQLLAGANCSAGLNIGCLNNNLADFPAQCTCYAPYYFDAGARIAEIVYDSHVVGNLTSFLVNASAPVLDNGRYSIDFTRSFSSVCKRALPLVGCSDVLTPTAPATPTDTTAYFCGCAGTFQGIPTLRTQTQLIDYLTEPTMLIAATAAAAAAIVPLPPQPSIATTAGLGAAVAFLVLILIGLGVYIASLKGLVKLPACCGACAAGIKARTGVAMPSGLGGGTKMMAPGSDWAPNSPQRVARANQLLPLPAGAGGAQAVQPSAVINPVPAAAAAAAALPPPADDAPAEPPGIAKD